MKKEMSHENINNPKNEVEYTLILNPDSKSSFSNYLDTDIKFDKVFNNKNKASDMFGTPKPKIKTTDH